MLCCYLLMPEMPIDIGLHLKKNHVLMLVVLTFFARRISLVHNLRYAPFMFCILYQYLVNFWFIISFLIC